MNLPPRGISRPQRLDAVATSACVAARPALMSPDSTRRSNTAALIVVAVAVALVVVILVVGGIAIIAR